MIMSLLLELMIIGMVMLIIAHMLVQMCLSLPLSVKARATSSTVEFCSISRRSLPSCHHQEQHLVLFVGFGVCAPARSINATVIIFSERVCVCKSVGTIKVVEIEDRQCGGYVAGTK